jgi:hypothetical protein
MQRYIDLAERALDTISKLAADQGNALLKAGGLNSTLAFIDFFPIALQRSAVTTSAKICDHVTPATFDLAKDIVPQLSNLLQYQDRTLIEAACDCFAKLIERCEPSPDHVMMLTEHGLVPKLLALVSSTPRLVGKSAVSKALGMIAAVLRACPVLAEDLHARGVGATITPLLMVTETSSSVDRSVSREQAAGAGTRLNLTATQLGHMMELLHELLPPLPKDVMVEQAPAVTTTRTSTWQWRDGNSWSSYDPDATATLEAALSEGQNDCTVQLGPHEYKADFTAMVQTNLGTGTKRKIRRNGPSRTGGGSAAGPASVASDSAKDPRTVYFATHQVQLQEFCEPLIPPLFDLLLSTANPELMRKVLRVLVKMLHWCSAAGLSEALRNLAVSSYVRASLPPSQKFAL